MNTRTESAISPCIKQCGLNDYNICLGCFRSMTEISCWVQADVQTRSHILNNAKLRSLYWQNSRQAIGQAETTDYPT